MLKADRLQTIHIAPDQRRRTSGPFWMILSLVGAVIGVGLFFAWPRKDDAIRVVSRSGKKEAVAPAAATATAPKAESAQAPETTPAADPGRDGVVLTVSGYIINRERIEVSPRFMGLVQWIGVKKGDRVEKGQIVVRLDDAEQKARLMEIEGQLAAARVAVERAKIGYERVKRLRASNNETAEREDEARLAVESTQAAIQQIEGVRNFARVQLEWTVIHSPIDGVVLEKLAEPGELVTPQSFGGTRGPSTALLAVADMNDLQVEIDVNESDLPKVQPGQRCRISPEAFPDRKYGGVVAEIAPEANRQKGTLQIKVQIENPDRYLTPELSAKVELLK